LTDQKPKNDEETAKDHRLKRTTCRSI